MQADTVQRVASELGIIGSARRPLVTLVIPLVEESVLETGCLNSYLTDGDRAQDLREFRDLVNAIAEDYLPVNRPADTTFIEGNLMLVLSRKKDERIVIGEDIFITVVEVRGDKVRLGIEAPKEVPIHRQEIFDLIAAKQEQGNAA